MKNRSLVIIVFALIPIMLSSCVTLGNSNIEYPDSNNAVIVIDVPETGIAWVVYREEESLKIDALEFEKIKRKTVVKQQKSFKIDVIVTNSEYILANIGMKLFFHQRENLYTIDIPDDTDNLNDITEIAISKTYNDVANVVFYDNTCFYFDTDGGVYIYNENEDMFNQYEEIQFPVGLKSFVLIRIENTNEFTERDTENSNEFKEKWGVDPTEELFPSNFTIPKVSTIERAKQIDEKEYPGKNTTIKALISFYNKALETYKKTTDSDLQPNDFSELKALLDSNRNEFSKILETAINDEKADFEEAQSKYFALGCLILPAINDKPEYAVIFKEFNENEEANNFRTLGQDTKLMGVLGDYFYTCTNENIVFYNRETLKKEPLKNKPFSNYETGVYISEKYESVLFSLDEKNNIFVTKRNIFNNKRYYLRTVNIHRDYYEIKPVEIDITGNTIFSITGIDDAFFCNFVEIINNKFIFLNIKKSKVHPGTKVRRTYIYHETPTGAGIKFFKEIKHE